MRQTKLKGWYEFTRTPCVICGHTGACMIHEKGDMVVCIRIESNKRFSKDSALPSYLHYLKGKDKKQIDKNEIEEINQGHAKKEDSILNDVYRCFVDCLELSDAHYEHLISPSRQLTDRQVMIRQYRSFPLNPWIIVNQMQDILGIDNFKGIPGFYLKSNKYWNIAGSNGILIPFRNQYNQIVGFQYRIDNPPNVVEVKINRQGLNARIKEQPDLVQVTFEGEIILEQKISLNKKWTTINHDNDILGWLRVVKGNRYFWLSSANKSEGTGSGSPVPVHVAVPTSKLKDWKEGQLHKAKTVWLSEGSLKCDIGADWVEKLYDPLELEDIGTTFLGLPGVGAWRLALPIMKEMGVEQVNICFDADAVSNVHVKKHLLECAKELKQLGYKANLVLWNEQEAKGIDDLFIKSKIPHLKKMF